MLFYVISLAVILKKTTLALISGMINKALKILMIIGVICIKAVAQDAVVISEGNFVRGEIKGTDFESVFIQIDDQAIKEYKAKDVRSFLWNGDTYESKPIIIGKKSAIKFFKLVEGGTVNLYSIGSTSEAEQPNYQAPVKSKPRVGVSLGTGGMGSGVGISFGGGGGQYEQATRPIGKPKVFYFIEKPGSGPIQEIAADGSRTSATKNLLLQKLTGDEGLRESIKSTESFDEKVLIALVKSYNESVK